MKARRLPRYLGYITLFFMLMMWEMREGAAGCRSFLTHAPILVFPKPVSVDKSAPIGSLLARGQTHIAARIMDNSYAGSAGDFVITINPLTQFTGLKYRGISIFKTNLDGVGVAYTVTPTNGSAEKRQITHNSKSLRGDAISSNLDYYLVKYGPISGGKLSRYKIFNVGYSCFASGGNGLYDWNGLMYGASVQVRACSVQKAKLNIPLEQVKESAFSGLNSTANEVAFSIPLNCAATDKIKIAIDGAGIEGSPDLLAVDSGNGTAQGIGIQLLYGGQPITLGYLFSGISFSETGCAQILLSARYYQKDEFIKAGRARSTANITLNYR